MIRSLRTQIALALIRATILTPCLWNAALADKRGEREHEQLTFDDAGILASVSGNRFDAGRTDGFFANLGTNGRTCNTCHVEAAGWTFTPRQARSLAPNDPLFTPNDGSDCPAISASQAANSALSSEVLNYGLIRVQLPIPATANYALVSATNPKGCAIAPGSAGVAGQLFLFRRPLPSTNLFFESAIMWDGRETLELLTTAAGLQSLGPLDFDLADQANSATTGHAQGAPIVNTPVQADIVAFETQLNTAQLNVFLPYQGLYAYLRADGAHGGPDYLEDVVAPEFFVGVNDPLKPGFSNASFDIFAAWEPTSRRYAKLEPGEQAIGRGEAIFNTTTFVIHDVPGLNSTASDPLYNASDPLAGQDIVGGCGVCHNNPNVGNHSSSLPINIGVTLAHPVNNDGSPNAFLDIGNLPVYTLKNVSTSATVQVTDPGKAMLSGKWTDIGKTKGPMLRGLAARAPYFHNGSAKDLMAVVQFYNARFQIGLTQQQMNDLVAFLSAL
jgi:cytochrome c peroxidase